MNKELTLEQRKARVIARGEHSNHSHVLVGDITVNKDGTFTVNSGTGYIKHLKESNWLAGEEVWTEEHVEIPLEPGTYKWIQQVEKHPYTEKIEAVRD